MAKNPKKRSRVSGPRSKDADRLFGQVKLMDRALAEGVREALRFHKRIGNPVARWRGGKVVWVQPEDIQVD
jgi:hypothetical protein